LHSAFSQENTRSGSSRSTAMQKMGRTINRCNTELVKFEEGEVKGHTSVCRLLPSRARGCVDSSSGIASEAAPANK
jgi:hypothetical protein